MVTVRHAPLDLELRHTFRISRDASDTRANLLVEIEHDGTTGLGEAAPITRYGQDRASAARAAVAMASRLGDPRAFATAAARAAARASTTEQAAATAAVDMALHDLAGQRLGAPLYALWGLDPDAVPPTSFTIAIDAPAAMAERARAAAEAGFRVLKIKLGGDDDRAIVEAVRAATDLPLRVDANEGWKPEEARVLLPWLAERGVELVEQPLAADRLDETRELRRASPLPIFADESAATAADVPRLAGVFDGVNVKLMKCGGPAAALEMIHVARACGLEVMLGCMIESSLAITAAVHLSPLVDHADLDGHLLIKNDPFVGATLVDGRLRPPDDPGLGVRWRDPTPR